jgi:iron uptake system component EfeO
MRPLWVAAAGAALVVAVSGCGSSSKTGATGTSVRKVAFTLTKAGCDPAHLQLPAGATTFDVKNDGADAVSEMELQQGGRIVGEVENLTPGLSRSFSVTLEPGTYQTMCPNGTSAAKGDLVVTGVAGPGTTVASASAAAAATAVTTYRAYVESEVAQLVITTTTFVDAVKGGDVASAKALFPQARIHYESVEPIAETFSSLDENIDARANDVPASTFRGFHRIEEQLWVAGNTAGMAHDADELLSDVKRLQAFLPTVKLEPAQIANGALELLNEVASSKITGEEDRYSHTDLWDFEGNLDGAKAAFTAVRPLLAKSASLATTIDRQFASTTDALKRYKRPDGGFVLYTTLTQTQTRGLAAPVEALADSLAKLPPLVVAA